MVSANVNTLREGKLVDAAANSGRCEVLELQFDVCKADVIGIQEGRSNNSIRKSGAVYEMLSSAATPAGCFGTQLWVRRAPGVRVMSWRPHDPRVVEATVEYDDVSLRVGFVSAHAPHEGCEHSERSCFFWRLCSPLLAGSHVAFIAWSSSSMPTPDSGVCPTSSLVMCSLRMRT